MTHLCSLEPQRNTSQLDLSWQNDWLRSVCAPVMQLPVLCKMQLHARWESLWLSAAGSSHV